MHSRGTEGQETPPDGFRPGERSGVPEPNDQALTAIANASQRAREATGGRPFRDAIGRASRRQLTERPGYRRPSIESRQPADPGSVWEPARSRGRTRARPVGRRLRRSRLARSVGTGVALGLAIAALIGVLNLVVGSSSHPTATVRTNSHPPTTAHPPTTLAKPRPAPAPSSTTPATQAPAPPTTVPTTAPPPPPLPQATSPAAPQLTAISPAGGAPGQVVKVFGANLISSNGIVVASFNGQLTRTDCPVTTACDVTVPSLGPTPGTAIVTVTTAQGRSNGLAFSYS